MLDRAAEPPQRTKAGADLSAYASIHSSSEFRELRKRYRSFVLRWTAVFLGWYLLYVVMSNWAPGFMSLRLVGNINVALVFGLLQFVSTFGIAWLYARHAGRELDPISDRLRRHYNDQKKPPR